MTKKKENNEILRANKINHTINRENMKEEKEKNRIEGKITKGSPDYIKRFVFIKGARVTLSGTKGNLVTLSGQAGNAYAK